MTEGQGVSKRRGFATGVYGFAFGVLLGFLMRAPGMDAVVPAFAINLCVMAALWLGIAIGAEGQERRAYFDIAAAVATFVLAAAALRLEPWLLVAGFAFQAWWSVQHRKGGFGVVGPAWFARFAAMANVGFVLSFSLLLGIF